jgi:hypothetical protein
MEAKSEHRHRLRQIISAAAVGPIEGRQPADAFAVIWALSAQ